MTIVLMYLRIINRVDKSLPMPFSYTEGERRFLATYLQYKPAIPHTLMVVNCGPHKTHVPFDPVVSSYGYYEGYGSDCGTYQAMGRMLDCDLLVCCNTGAYFWCDGWLERLAEARQKHGPGVYGVTASHERRPHLRTPCIACDPAVLRAYPLVCDSRAKAYEFESGANNFSLWAGRHGYPAMLVAGDGIYPMGWRNPANIFRRGDQSNCLVWDRHTDVWQHATPEVRLRLSRAADGFRYV